MPQSDPDPLRWFKGSSPLYSGPQDLSPWIPSVEEVKAWEDLSVGKTSKVLDTARIRALIEDARHACRDNKPTEAEDCLDEILDLIKDA